MLGTPLVRATPGGTGAGAGRGSSGTWCVRRESIGSPAPAGGSPRPARCREPAPRTIADGLRGMLGDKTFPEIREKVDDVVTVSEAGIVSAMLSRHD